MASSADLDAITELEAGVFPDPWNRDSFEQSLGDTFLLAELGSEIIGYIVGRNAGLEAEILSIGVIASWRKKGVGNCLLKETVSRFQAAGAIDLFLEVRESNETAILFYSGLDFQQVGIRANYYRFPRENALIMMRKIFPD